jgi:hypothetical protein
MTCLKHLIKFMDMFMSPYDDGVPLNNINFGYFEYLCNKRQPIEEVIWSYLRLSNGCLPCFGARGPESGKKCLLFAI